MTKTVKLITAAAATHKQGSTSIVIITAVNLSQVSRSVANVHHLLNTF